MPFSTALGARTGYWKLTQKGTDKTPIENLTDRIKDELYLCMLWKFAGLPFSASLKYIEIHVIDAKLKSLTYVYL